MKTVHEVSELTGVSIRTLHYYDKIGLLHPADVTESGYRLYDDTALERLQFILLFRELQFPLKDIRTILDSTDFDRTKALEQQIDLLQLKKEHLENLIDFARGIKAIGVKTMDFSAFDTRTIDDYARQAKAMYGNTDAYKEFEEKNKNRSESEEQEIQSELIQIFEEFGKLLSLRPGEDKVQELVKQLQDFITENFYTCTTEILKCLGKMYAGGGTITENIDGAAGKGTAEFVAEAIKIYCN